MTTPNTPTSQEPIPLIGLDPYNGKTQRIAGNREVSVEEFYQEMLSIVPYYEEAMKKPKRKRYSRKEWRLRKVMLKELSQMEIPIIGCPETYPKSIDPKSDYMMSLGVFLKGATEPRGFNYEIDCKPIRR